MTGPRCNADEYPDTVATSQEHLPEAVQRRFVAGFFTGAASCPDWDRAKDHLVVCAACLDGAMRCAQEIWEFPAWRLLESGEFARRVEQIWVERLREHARPAMRAAAARELGDLRPIGQRGLGALVDAVLSDPDERVRIAAQAALTVTIAREPVAACVRRFAEVEA